VDYLHARGASMPSFPLYHSITATTTFHMLYPTCISTSFLHAIQHLLLYAAPPGNIFSVRLLVPQLMLPFQL